MEKDRIEEILNGFRQLNRDALIPVLQAIQSEFGYLPDEAIILIGDRLSLPASKIYGLVTFYNQFTLKAKGKYHIKVCDGTACHIDRSTSILKEIYKLLGIEDGMTTKDGMFSLEVQTCIGACGQSPVIAINDRYYPKVDPAEIKDIIEEIASRHR